MNLFDFLSDLIDGLGDEREGQDKRTPLRRASNQYDQSDRYKDRRDTRRERDFEFFGD